MWNYIWLVIPFSIVYLIIENGRLEQRVKTLEDKINIQKADIRLINRNVQQLMGNSK